MYTRSKLMYFALLLTIITIFTEEANGSTENLYNTFLDLEKLPNEFDMLQEKDADYYYLKQKGYVEALVTKRDENQKPIEIKYFDDRNNNDLESNVIDFTMKWESPDAFNFQCPIKKHKFKLGDKIKMTNQRISVTWFYTITSVNPFIVERDGVNKRNQHKGLLSKFVDWRFDISKVTGLARLQYVEFWLEKPKGSLMMIFVFQMILCVIFGNTEANLFPWRQSWTPFIYNTIAMVFLILTNFILIIKNKTGYLVNSEGVAIQARFPSKFYEADISAHLMFKWPISIPGYIVTSIFTFLGAYYQHPVYYLNHIIPGNIIALILMSMACLGLILVVLFPPGTMKELEILKPVVRHQWPIRNQFIHSTSAVITFISFLLYQWILNAALAIDVLVHPHFAFVLPVVIILCLIITNFTATYQILHWIHSGGSKREWLGAFSIMVYFLLLSVLSVLVDPLGEGEYKQ